MPEPLYRLELPAQELLTRHPPRFKHAHKIAIFERAYPERRTDAAPVSVTCWRALTISELDFGSTIPVAIRPDFYDYSAAGDPAAVLEWHVNFADPKLFVAYASGLLAQDEMQVVEHPLLGSVLEALIARGLPTTTVTDDEPTPVLVRQIERRIRLETSPDARAGRPHGLYGGLFAPASLDAVLRATSCVQQASASSIIAMAAPLGGYGRYRPGEIMRAFVTAWTGFDAARRESASLPSGSRQALIHSGLWGCGVFGGNRVLMLAVQILAARAAGVAGLVLHVGHDLPAPFMAQDAVELADELVTRCGGRCSTDALIAELAGRGFEWGVGDGN